MLLRSAVLLYLISFLPICPSQFCDRIGTGYPEQSTQVSASQTANSSTSTRRQFKKTSLVLHTEPPKALYALEGDGKYLECMAGGTPPPTIHWLKDGIVTQGDASEDSRNMSSINDPVSGNKRFIFSFTKSRLYLDCLSMEDRGEYTCVAQNPYHRISASTKLVVLAYDDEIECKETSNGGVPRINLWTEKMLAARGNETKLICRANGDPTPTVTWFEMKGQELANADSDKYEVLPNGDLIIRNLKFSDGGMYSCKAENVHGEAKVDVSLHSLKEESRANGSQSASSRVNGSQSASIILGSNDTNWQLKTRHLHFHTIPPRVLDASEGDRKYLECQAGGIPAPMIHWLKDGILITQGEASDEYHQNLSSTNYPVSSRIHASFTTSRLYLDCLSVADQGEYTCVAENAYRRISATTKFTVQSSEEVECEKSEGEAPRINLWTKRMFASQGDVKFMCRALGDPRPTVTWLNSEKEELTNADFDKYEVLPSGDLIVRNVSSSDMGTYSCKAENVHGEYEVEAFLFPTLETQANGSQSSSSGYITKKKFKKTHLQLHTIPPQTVRAFEGLSEYLECMAGGIPAPVTIHWLKDGILVTQGETSDYQNSSSTNASVSADRRFSLGFTTSRLYLDCPTVEDQGKYTCVAQNPSHSISKSTKLIVLPFDDTTECEKSSHGQAPKINLWTKTVFGTLGDEAKLICRANGEPTPTVRWWKEKELTNDDFDKYEVLPNGDLMVRNLSSSDMGTYSCKAENVHGESKVEAFLLPFLDPSEANSSQSASSSNRTKRQFRQGHLRLHIIPPEALNVSEDTSKYLECMAGGTPSPTIHWLKDGIRISQGETSERHQNLSSANDPISSMHASFTLSRLYLDCLSVEDQGEYTCVAENPFNNLTASTNLAVLASEEIECEKKCHGQAPRINLWTKTMIAFQGDNTKFICRANGDPTPTIKWLGLEKEELTNDDLDKYEVLPNGYLVVRDLSWSDMGTYTCIAENAHGESKVEVFLYPTAMDLPGQSIAG